MSVAFETPVVFQSQGVPLVGLILRDRANLIDRQPGVVITGSWLTVKEQMPILYARRLARLGFTALVLDFAGFGQSAGEPRQAEMPHRKIADIQAAAAFLSAQSYVTRGGVGQLAICASAQYALAALANGAAIRSFASVAGWYHDAASVQPFYGGPEGVAMRLGRAAEAAERFARTREVVMVPAFEDGNDRAGMFFPADYYSRAERGAIPEWRNEMAEMSWLHWLSFDGLSAAEQVTTPTLLVHGDGCVLPDHVRQIHARLRGEKRLAWVEGGQVDFYDQPDLVDRALAEVVPWFEQTLRPVTASDSVAAE